MTIEEAVLLAKEAGFQEVAPLDAKLIELRQEVRDTCAKNTCGRYGKNWSCPPGCGELEECAARIAKYSHGIVVQTVGELEDEFDGEGMMEASKRHGENFRKLTPKLREAFPDLLPFGVGSCSNCKTCTYPDAPCRDPHGAVAPMEGYGMIVSDVCTAAGMPYYHGKGTITYVACYLLD